MGEAGERGVLLGVLGPLLLRGGHGEPVALGSARQRRLLLALALRANRPVEVGVLADMVWGDAPPADPDGALHTNLARLRRALPPELTIRTGTRSYELSLGADALDTTRFAGLLDGAAGAADPASRLAALDAALALWRGRPFAELDHPAAGPEVTRLTELQHAALEQRAAALLDAGRFGEAVVAAEAVVVAEPLREAAVAVLIRALVGAGRQGAALAAYARLRDRLADELGVEPSAALRELHVQVLRQQVPVPAGPRTGGAATAVRLPRAPRRPGLPASSFVGRDADLVAVAGLLGEHRVATLCGPGGVGKTRLAAHVAVQVADRYDDGVLLVEFGHGGPADVGSALAAALGLTDVRAGALAELVVDALAVRRQLLVLDNCEHVADEVAAVVEAVTVGAADVDMLVTSREPLRVDGEQVHVVAPLSGSSAAQLLTDRIRAADPAAAAPGDGQLVEQVCRRLDGLPLALELAAGRAVALGLPGLLAELERPSALDVLRGGRRTAAPRHRSLRELVDWSYGLLDDAQRTLFDQLSVFAGAVELAAVRAVCQHPDRLPDLVERSLVVRHPGEPSRFGMLETLRAYGRARLATDPSGAQLRARHAAWAVELAAGVQFARRGPGEAAAVRRFDDHLPDLHRAHEWLCAAGPIADLLRLTVPFAELAYLRGRVDLLRVLERTLRVVGAGEDGAADRAGASIHPLVPRLLGMSATVQWMHGNLDLSAQQANRALALAARSGDPASACDAYEALANVASFRGELDTAIEHAEVSQALYVTAGDLEGQILALTDLTTLSAYRGDDPASERYERALAATAERLGSPTARAWMCYAMGERRAESGAPAAAEYLAAAVRAAEEVGSGFVAGVARHTLLTSAARDAADPAAVLAGFGPLIDHWHGFGAWTQLWIAVRALIETLSRVERHAEVAVLLAALRASPRASRVFGTDAGRLDAVEWLARAALGARFDVLSARGAALGDARAIAVARRSTRAG